MEASPPPCARQACGRALLGSLEGIPASYQYSAARTEGHGGAERDPRGQLLNIRKTRALTLLLSLEDVLEKVYRDTVVLGQVRARVNGEEGVDLTLAPELGRERVHVHSFKLADLVLKAVHT